jgi:hypothetical protein
VSPGARDSLDLALCAPFATGYFCCYVAGVVDEDRTLSRSAAPAFRFSREDRAKPS